MVCLLEGPTSQVDTICPAYQSFSATLGADAGRTNGAPTLVLAKATGDDSNRRTLAASPTTVEPTRDAADNSVRLAVGLDDCEHGGHADKQKRK